MIEFQHPIIYKLNNSEMKKALAIVALIAAMFVAGNVQAQTTINVGYAPETFSYGNSSYNLQGFYAGFTQNIGLYKGINVAAGAQFRMNTRSNSEINGSIKIKETQTLIDVPVLFNYGIDINRDLKISPFVGPMVTLALTGNTNTKTFLGNTQLTDTDTNWYGDNSGLNRFNLNVVFGADVRFKKFNLHGGYRIGLIDQIKRENGTLNTSGFFVGLGYTL